MKKDRDMMYYGMETYSAMPYPMQAYPYMQQMQNNNQDIEMRLSRIERQIRRLDSRVSRLENPYPDSPNYQTTNNTDTPFKIENSMYMM